MHPAEIRTFMDYNSWANDRILAQATKLTHQQFTAPHPVSFKSLRGTLVHIYGAEWAWRKRMQEGVSPKALPGEEDFPTLEALRESWDAQRAMMGLLLEGLTEAKLASSFRYLRTGTNEEYATPHWQALLHVVNHGTQYRSEAGVILSGYGHSPGDLDFMLYVRSI